MKPPLTLLLLMSAAAFAQAPLQPPVGAPVPVSKATPELPKISDSMKARWWRTVAEANAAQLEAARTKAAVDEVRTALMAACGEAQLAPDAQGEPTCAVKAEPKK